MQRTINLRFSSLFFVLFAVPANLWPSQVQVEYKVRAAAVFAATQTQGESSALEGCPEVVVKKMYQFLARGKRLSKSFFMILLKRCRQS